MNGRNRLIHLGIACTLVGAQLPVRAMADQNRFAVLIGIDSYQDKSIPLLEGAVADARGIGSALVDVLGFPRDHVRYLLAERGTSSSGVSPTGTAIAHALDWLRKSAKPGDIVFFFFAGHGNQYENKAYFMPCNVDMSGPSVFTQTAIPADTVNHDLSNLKDCVVIAAFDMCRDTAAFVDDQARGIKFNFPMGVLEAGSALGNGKRSAAVHRGGGQVTLLSCSPGQSSHEWGHPRRGCFSYLLELSIRHAADASGKLTVGYILDSLDNTLTGSAGAIGHGDQVPESHTDPDAVRHEAPLPAELLANMIGDGTRDQAAYLAPFQRGYTYYLAGKVKEAEDDFKKAAAKLRTAVVLRMLGDCRLRLNDAKGAEAHFENAVGVDPKFAPAWNDLGYVYYQIYKKLPKARRLFARAMRLAPNDPQPVDSLADVMDDLHHPLRSLALHNRAYALSPYYPLFEGNLAWELQKLHRIKQATYHARRAVALGLRQINLPDVDSLLKDLAPLLADPKGRRAPPPSRAGV
jgi:tetratricopeptide (TPR) repeat protein